jgi:uncharacterized protein involved in type VI secretion and phage assembly
MSAPLLAAMGAALALAVVTDDDDPQLRGRVKVRVAALDVELWAPVVHPSFGDGYGVALLPKVDEIVVVAFVTPEQPIVLGAVGSGRQSAPTEATPTHTRYSITTPKGTVLLFDDDAGPKLSITTPAGNKFELTDDAGGKATIDVQGTKVEVTSSKVEIQASAEVSVTAGSVTVDAGMASFSGVVKCSTLIADAVVGTSYTPGAGNIW